MSESGNILPSTCISSVSNSLQENNARVREQSLSISGSIENTSSTSPSDPDGLVMSSDSLVRIPVSLDGRCGISNIPQAVKGVGDDGNCVEQTDEKEYHLERKKFLASQLALRSDHNADAQPNIIRITQDLESNNTEMQKKSRGNKWKDGDNDKSHPRIIPDKNAGSESNKTRIPQDWESNNTEMKGARDDKKLKDVDNVTYPLQVPQRSPDYKDQGPGLLPVLGVVEEQEGPDFKAQVNRRSLVGAAAMIDSRQRFKESNDEAGSDDWTNSTEQDTPQHSHANSPDAPVFEYLPGFKAQSQRIPPLISSRSPIPSPRVSNNNNITGSGQTNRHSRSEHLPVVDAVLVSSVFLAPEPQQQQQQQLREEIHSPMSIRHDLENGSGTSTAPNTSNSGSNNKGPDQPMKIPVSERQFWITVIAMAVCLNSLLVGGAVVGGFCAAGLCSGRSDKLIDATTVATTNTPTTPSVSPQTRDVSEAPSILPTVAPSRRFHGGKGAYTKSPQPTVTRYPTDLPTFTPQPSTSFPTYQPSISSEPSTSQRPSFPPDTYFPTSYLPPPTAPLESTLPTITPAPKELETSGPAPYDISIGTASPNQSPIPVSIPAPVPISIQAPVPVAISYPVPDQSPITVSINSLSPTMKPSLSPHPPTNSPKTNTGDPSDTGATEQNPNKLSLSFLIPILVGLELGIMTGLYFYYCRWKRQRTIYADVKANAVIRDTASNNE